MYSFVLVFSCFAAVITTNGQIQSSATTCAVPSSSPDKTFAIYDNNDQLIKGDRVPKGGYIQSQCADGYLFSDGSSTSVSICRPTSKAEWYPAIKSCRRICTPLKPSNNLVLTCKYHGHEIGCDDSPMFSGVEITPRCKELHHVSQNFIPDYTTIRCRDDGTWNNKLFRCDPDCGLPLQDLLIENGSNATLGQFPWHVAIYYIPRGYRLICGGTLVAPNVVLSAAHCFYNESFGYPLTTPDDYAIVVGKLTRNYTRIDSDAQKRLPISEILFNDDKPFNPKLSGYSADIALIILKERVTISAHVLPACFRTHYSVGFKPEAGVKGILCGWGLDETREPSELLKTTQLPFVQYNQCLKKLPGLTFDKFCAGSDQGPRARPGDSGGGLVFKDTRTNLYYVRGLVSTSERFSTAALTSFTDISYYQDWIDRIVQEKSGSDEIHVQLETSTGRQRTSTVASILPPQKPATRSTTIAPTKATSPYQAGNPIMLPSMDTSCNSIRAKYEHFSWSCGPLSCSEGKNSLHNRYLFEKVHCDNDAPSRICCPKFDFKLTPSPSSANSNTMSATSLQQAGPIPLPSMDTSCNSIRAKYEHFSWSCGPRSCSDGEKSLHNRYLFEKVRCANDDPSRICCPKFDFESPTVVAGVTQISRTTQEPTVRPNAGAVITFDSTCNSQRTKYEHFTWSCAPRNCSEGEKSLHNLYLLEKVRCNRQDTSYICCPTFERKQN